MSDCLSALRQQIIPQYDQFRGEITTVDPHSYKGQIKHIGVGVFITALNHADTFCTEINQAQAKGFFEDDKHHHHFELRISRVLNRHRHPGVPSHESIVSDEESKNQIERVVSPANSEKEIEPKHHGLRNRFRVHRSKGTSSLHTSSAPSEEPPFDSEPKEEWEKRIVESIEKSKQEITAEYDQVCQQIINTIKSLPWSLRDEAQAYWDKVNSTVGKVLAGVISKIVDIIDAIKKWAKGVWKNIKVAFTHIRDIFDSAWKTIIEL